MSGTRQSPIFILDDDDGSTNLAYPSINRLQSLPALPSKKRKRRQIIYIDDDDEPVAGPSHASAIKKPKLQHTQGPATPEIQEIEENQSVSTSEWLNSSSEWVNSMVQASEPNMWPADWPAIFPPFIPPLPLMPLMPLNQPKAPVDQSQNIPPSIGMSPDKDAAGRRSTFVLSSSTTFVSFLDVSYPYTPDPERTLILDQLPKTHRTPKWFIEWSNKVCAASPVFLALDSVYAKALVTFATAEHARKAWCSPRLAMKIKKNKPREDLIRAWWYKPTDPPVSFGSPELEPEEGEIVDEDKVTMKRMHPLSAPTATTNTTAIAPSTDQSDTPYNLRQRRISTSNAEATLATSQSSTDPVLPPPPPHLPHRPQFTTPTTTETETRQNATRTAVSESSTQEAETIAAEQRLRQLVLASKKQKQSFHTAPTLHDESRPAPTVAVPRVESHPTIANSSSTATMNNSRSVTPTQSLDDLASSFIADAIQTVKPIVPKATLSASNARLAALNQEIAERNLLFTKLAAAKTKQEREQLLVILRQKDREAKPVFASRSTSTVSRLRWPVIDCKEQCVLILSDDEDDDTTTDE